jgi:hypothetical protein
LARMDQRDEQMEILLRRFELADHPQ